MLRGIYFTFEKLVEVMAVHWHRKQGQMLVGHSIETTLPAPTPPAIHQDSFVVGCPVTLGSTGSFLELSRTQRQEFTGPRQWGRRHTAYLDTFPLLINDNYSCKLLFFPVETQPSALSTRFLS